VVEHHDRYLLLTIRSISESELNLITANKDGVDFAEKEQNCA
jgi:hypothetical protein